MIQPSGRAILSKQVSIHFPSDATPVSYTHLPIMEYLENALPEKNSCALLEAGNNYGVFMINYPGIEKNKEDVICLLLTDYCRETGSLASVSNGASSPLEIPYLYENAMLADKFRQATPVSAYADIAGKIPDTSNLSYPYDSLDSLALCLKTPDFSTAHQLKEELFAQIDSVSGNESLFPDFFIRCVLICLLYTSSPELSPWTMMIAPIRRVVIPQEVW